MIQPAQLSRDAEASRPAIRRIDGRAPTLPGSIKTSPCIAVDEELRMIAANEEAFRAPYGVFLNALPPLTAKRGPPR